MASFYPLSTEPSTLTPLSVPKVSLLKIPYIGLRHHLSACEWLSVLSLRPGHVVARDRIPFSAAFYPFSWHWGHFHRLAKVSDTVMNTHEQTSLQDPVLSCFVCAPTTGIMEYDNSVFSASRNTSTDFHVSQVLISPHLHGHLMCCFFPSSSISFSPSCHFPSSTPSLNLFLESNHPTKYEVMQY